MAGQVAKTFARSFRRASSALRILAAQFVAEKISDRNFVWSDGFDVDQAASE